MRLLAFLVAFFSAATASAAASNNVRVDMTGYLPAESKYGMVAGGAPTGAFDIRRSSDNVSVFSATLAAAFTDADSGDSIRTADFSSVNTTGTYYLDVAGVGQSYPFDIGPNAFASAYVYAVRGFYGQRCGMAVNLGNVDGVTYAYPSCHTSGACNDNPASYHTSSGKTGTKNTTGGWHDAGDYGKYIVNSGISTGELLWTWECWSDRLAGVSSNIPESGNGTPDVLNEARWNLQWMLKMQDTDGGVWHKNTSAGFGSFVLPNADDSGTRYVIGSGNNPYKTTCSTADFAAVMAIAARLFQPYDATFAATCLTAAQNAYTWAIANPAQYFNNPGGISTGGYGDGNATDELLWAAAELFRTTGTATYNTYVTSNTPGTTLFGTGLQQDWAGVRNLAMWTYYFSGQATANAALRTRIFNDTTTAATSIANRTNGATNGYKVSLNGGGQYIWGSNGAVANYAIMLLMADKMSPSANYRNAALNDLHYLLGRNTHNTSFVTHVGEKAFLHPHHRPSGAPSYSAGAPWPGLLSGGPNSSNTDGSGLDALPGNPPAKRWVDQQASYAGNEIAINWQAPLVFLLAYTLPTPVTGSPTPTATPTATRTATPSATRSATASATPSPSPSATPSATQTRSPSSTATRTVTPTATQSATLSATPTVTGTATRSASPSATPSYSGTPSGTPSQTPTATRTASTTRTATATVTPTFTPSVTRTISPTFTNSPIASDTVSPTTSPSWTSSPSATLSATPSFTFTATVTPTSSPTASSTVTPSQTPSVSPTFSHSPPVSPTDSPTTTPSWTVSPTATRSATATASPTESSTLTASPTPSYSATLTATPSQTLTLTLTATPTVSLTVSLTPVLTATPTATPSASPTDGPTPSTDEGVLHIPDAQFYPHPVLGPNLRLRFRLDGSAERVKLKLYSRAMVCVEVLEASGSYQAGWNQADFVAPELPAGAWFGLLHAYRGSLESAERPPLRLVKLR